MHSVSKQLSEFFSCLIVGVVVGLIHDTFFFKKILKRRTKDLVFFISSTLSTIVVISGLYYINYYTIRWYTFLAIACGFCFYKNSISFLYRRILKRVTKFYLLTKDNL
ncbi:spore cortex biosynthesis protein YabQ [Caldicellulosiruptor naganoensis]|uniref:Spore cortex biosynthesis protein YabQ n=1 Tax=Caldicellulosiruptor naganoensis TaxID=29324 RepID=A0ABY7BIL2_9FIRM|nr:spore cortex biosynthesis protein YabQ [Caldicellulosiruptor naganoensis]WAM32665.1 spore cortex biosynthesis protein YabQ [Caldicellulosiruptor naganoensis]